MEKLQLQKKFVDKTASAAENRVAKVAEKALSCAAMNALVGAYTHSSQNNANQMSTNKDGDNQ